MKHLLIIMCMFFLSCTVTKIVEIPSPELCKTAYAISDSFDAARIDQAEVYTTQLLRLVIPPEKKILIEPILKDGKRIAVIPEKYRDDSVVVVGSEEWKKLQEIKEIASQLKEERDRIAAAKTDVDAELRKQKKITNDLISTNTELQLSLAAKDTIISEKSGKIFRLYSYLAAIWVAIAAYVYLKFNKIIPF